MSELKRSDNQYVEVEEFADYELTQCIAYEMAARDWHYKNIADRVITHYEHHKESIDYYLNRGLNSPINIEKSPKRNGEYMVVFTLNNDNTHKVDEAKFNEGVKRYSELTSLIGEIDLVALEDIPIGYKDPRLGKEFWEIKDMIDGIYGYGVEHPYKNTEIIKNQDYEEISVINRQYREGYYIESALSTPEDDCYLDDEPE